jgi:outer membrane protein assembly factor BamB
MSKLLALDGQTGAVAYEVARPVAASWTSPCVITVKGGVQLITCADPLVIAYDPADGSEIWRADCITGEAGPSPVESNGVVHVGNEYCIWSAIRADGKGDVTESHVLWNAEDGLPDTCSPLVTSDYLFLCSYYLYCYDVKTGELLWDTYDIEEAQFETGFVSSPSWVAGRVYLFEEDGKGWILEPTRETAKVIAKNPLGEECLTSPAFQDGRMYIRGKEHLFCIGQ